MDNTKFDFFFLFSTADMSVWRVPAYLKFLTLGLNGGLRFIQMQKWKSLDIPDTQPSLSDAAVKID